MAEVLFHYSGIWIIILYYQVEIFTSFCFKNVVFVAKNIKIQNNFQNLTGDLNTRFSGIFWFLLLFFITWKTSNTQTLIILIIAATIILWKLYSFICLIQKDSVSSSSIVNLVIGIILSFLICMPYLSSFLHFFFFIEIYGVFYYFVFLVSHSVSQQTIISYKTGLLYLLWNNFLTTIFLALGCFFLFKLAGTTSFGELNLLVINYSNIGIFFFLVGLSWKLGLPVFHFFKLEVYKFLLKENVFAFIIITTLVNLFILLFTFSQSIVITTVYLWNPIILLLLFIIGFIITQLKVVNLLQFFAISSLLTFSTVLSLLLIS